MGSLVALVTGLFSTVTTFLSGTWTKVSGLVSGGLAWVTGLFTKEES